MNCPDAGTWRAWIDGAADLAQAEQHLAACGECSAEVERIRSDAAYASSAIAVLAPARTDLQTEQQVAAARSWGSRWARPAASAAAALAAVAIVATPAGRSAAADFLAAFRSEQFTVVDVGDQDVDDAFAAFEELGAVDASGSDPEPYQVADAQAAEEVLGRALLQPDPETLPGGVAGEREFLVTSGATMRFTFDEERTRAYLRQQGAEDLAVPAGYDGAELVVTVPPAAVQEFRGRDGRPALLIGQGSSMTADVSGDLDLADLRTFVLQLPGLPADLKDQLAAIEDWRTTLPLPIPLDQMEAVDTTFAGKDAIVVSEQGLGTGLIWHDGGTITGVAGVADEDRIRAIAEGLRSAP